ncbi:uncharacterized protein [Diadema antillarum]|uniref:uncharacterized protein n=1 Tax=Diadema antillarum TaxID=105358 RepID=UPI003A8C3A15
MGTENTSSPASLDPLDEIPAVVDATVIVVLAVLVNFMSFWTLLVVRSFRYITSPDVLIGGLAFVDYVSSWTMYPLIAYVYLSNGPFGPLVCDFFYAMWAFFQLVSMFIVTLMATDRYLAIRKPIFYRVKFKVDSVKYVILSFGIAALLACFTPTIILNFARSSERDGTRLTAQACVGTNNQTYRFLQIVILVFNYSLCAIGLFCYMKFLVGIRNFVNRSMGSLEKKTVSASAVSSSYCLSCLCCQEQPQRYLTRGELVEHTLQLMKTIHIKRCTRITKAIAVAVGFFYLTWLPAQISVTLHLVASTHVPILDYIVTRLILAGPILNPLVFAFFAKSYRFGYQRVLFSPLRCCGYEWRSRKPLGLSASEMQRISHRMALEEWQSPGLIRRQYSKRKSVKRRQGIIRCHGIYNVNDEARSTDNMEMKSYEQSTPTSEDAVTLIASKSTDVSTPPYHDNPMSCDGALTMSGEDANCSATVAVSGSDKTVADFQYTSPDDGTLVVSAASSENCVSDGSSIDDESGYGDASSSNESPSNPKTRVEKSTQLSLANSETNHCGKGVADNQLERNRAGLAARSDRCIIRAVVNENGASADGLARINVEVIELVSRDEMRQADGSITDSCRNCRLSSNARSYRRSVSQPASFVFSLRENRFVPKQEDDEEEVSKSFSCSYSDDLFPRCRATLQDSKPISNPVFRSDEREEQGSARKARQLNGPKRTSKALRDSTHYVDDIVKLNDLIQRRQKAEEL